MNQVLHRRRSDAGFTLIELVVTVSIMGLIVVALTGVVMSYLQTTVSTSARLTESHDVQFAAVYWQRDVASIGLRSATYDDADSVHSFPLLQSMAANGNTGVTPGCAMPSGASTVVTLAWSQYTSLNSSDPPTIVTVAYATEGTAAPYALIRVRCTGSSQDSVTTVADNLASVPVVACPGGCNGMGSSVPTIATMTLVSSDPDNSDGSTAYSATLTGERRET